MPGPAAERTSRRAGCPPAFLNLVAGANDAVTTPFVALVTAYVHFDARARLELESEPEPGELPAEYRLST